MNTTTRSPGDFPSERL
jgi:hypothetical protein